MNYNKFRILVGKIMILVFLFLMLLIKNQFNYQAIWLMILGFSLRIWAAGYIHKNQEVTTAGPYKLVRNPLYLGSFIAGLGFVMFLNYLPFIIGYLVVFLAVYYQKMRLEEKYLLDMFGEQFSLYQKTTPLFIPNPAKLFVRDNTSFSWRGVLLNREHLNALGGVLIVIFFILFRRIVH